MQRPALAPALHAVINQGPNAGRRKPITDLCIDRQRATLFVSCALKARGFVVLDVKIMDGAKPVVMVEHDKHTQEMLETRNARYVTDGISQMGRHRIGQFEIDGVAVQWEEWGAAR